MERSCDHLAACGGRGAARNAIPSTIIVDREGRVAARVVGTTTYVTLGDLVDDVLAEDPGNANP